MEVRIDELNALIDFVNDKTHLDGYTKEWGGETSWNLSKIAKHFNTDRFSIIHRFKVAKIPHYPIDEIIPHYSDNEQGGSKRAFVGRNITGLDIRRNRQIHDAYRLAFLFDSRGFKRGSIFVFSHNNKILACYDDLEIALEGASAYIEAKENLKQLNFKSSKDESSITLEAKNNKLEILAVILTKATREDLEDL